MYFSEYLPRLNSISVALDVQSGFNIDEINRISIVGELLSIELKNNPPINVHLPCKASQASITGLKLANNTVSFGVKIHEKRLDSTVPFTDQAIEKWSCKDLSQTPKIGRNHKFIFVCKNCNSELIDSSQYDFKDMPSEQWYEMMDFWHCHKPENYEKHKKEYKGILKPDNKTIIIGSYYLLEKSNRNIVKIQDSITCNKCGQLLGEMFQGTLKIFKWCVELQFESGNAIHKEQYRPGLFIYNIILDKINFSAVRKFKIEVEAQSKFIWIMSLGLNVVIDGKICHNALKVLCADNVSKEESYETLDVPYPEVAKLFLNDIKTINSLMPVSMRSVSIGTDNYLISYLSYI